MPLPNLHKGRSQIFKGKDYNEIELLYSTKKKYHINKTISNANLHNLMKFSPSNRREKEKEESKVDSD